MEVVRQAENALEVQSSLAIHALLAGTSLDRLSEWRMNDVDDHFELIFVRQGVLLIGEGGRAFEVLAGQSMLLWPHQWHWGMQHHSPETCFFWLRFRVKDALRTELSMNREQTLCVPQHANAKRPEYLESLFRRYLDDQDAGHLLPPYANVLAWLMLAEVAHFRTVAEAEKKVANGPKKALAYIRSHCHLPLTASKIADKLGYDRAYLNRVFHQTYHHTLTEEIHQSRMARARQLLLHSDMSVCEIARACGFTDIKYFFRLFRKYEGTTPQAFRHVKEQGRANCE